MTTKYCICNSAQQTRFSGGYLATPHTDVIEISLKFEKIFDESFSVNNIIKNNDDDPTFERCNLNFVELSDKTLKDLYNNELVHDCVRELLISILKKKSETNNTSQDANETPLITTTTDVTIHQSAILNSNNNKNDDIMDNNNELKVMQRNSSKRSSMKSCKSMETVLEKATSRPKDKSPDETKAKSVGNVNDEDELEGVEDFENGESIELIFISDEFVNRVQKQEQEVIIVDEKDGKRRNSLTNKKKIVIITDQYKEKVLRNNSIVLTNEKKMLKKGSKKAKTYTTNSNSFLPYDEDERYEHFEIKKLDNVDVEKKDLSPN